MGELTQAEMILALLRVRGERGMTALEALSEVGSARLAARIKDLRDQGHDIETRHVKTARGATIACYVLHQPEPVKPEWEEVPLWG